MGVPVVDWTTPSACCAASAGVCSGTGAGGCVMPCGSKKFSAGAAAAASRSGGPGNGCSFTRRGFGPCVQHGSK